MIRTSIEAGSRRSYAAPPDRPQTRLPTFADLGLEANRPNRGSLTLLAGRPGCGKSALALHVAAQVAGAHKLPVLFVSADASPVELGERLLAARAGFDCRDGLRYLTADRRARILRASKELDGAPLWIWNTPSPTTAAIAHIAHEANGRRRLGLIVVDGLELIESAPGASRLRRREAAAYSLRRLSRELETPILATLRLRRRSYSVAPQLAELGTIEQYSDRVWALHQLDERKPDWRGWHRAKLFMRKPRGRTIRLTWRPEIGSFQGVNECKPA